MIVASYTATRVILQSTADVFKFLVEFITLMPSAVLLEICFDKAVGGERNIPADVDVLHKGDPLHLPAQRYVCKAQEEHFLKDSDEIRHELIRRDGKTTQNERNQFLHGSLLP